MSKQIPSHGFCSISNCNRYNLILLFIGKEFMLNTVTLTANFLYPQNKTELITISLYIRE